MAFQSVWYFSDIPSSIIDIIETDIQKFDSNLNESIISNNVIDHKIRKSKNSWVPTNHWLSGFLWHYVQRANRENFLYDITNIDGECLQYTSYGKSEFYSWHDDSGVMGLYKPQAVGNRDNNALVQDFLNKNVEYVRKLSVVLQLSDPETYEGGNLELIDESGEVYIAPRIRGTVIVFDSRTRHRVLPVTNGNRKSIVGWVVGPRWK
jgi:predicted 2-oxoglutarate/Fe(II)-dependent dioxygenase YbiX